MSQFNFRKRVRISYCETEEPNLDEYVFCTQCADYVYEYCSLHGPLLVIPDEKVPAVTNYPSYVPRSALTTPKAFLHLNYSTIPGAGLGVFSSVTLPADVRFGPYVGEATEDVDSDYCWQIYDNARRPLYPVDGGNPDRSNWMRFVNCARHWLEQNLVAYQYCGQIYYRTLRIIPRHTELLVYYGGEFAARLGVDVRRYNAPAHHRTDLVTLAAHLEGPNLNKVIEKQHVGSTDTPASKSQSTTLANQMRDDNPSGKNKLKTEEEREPLSSNSVNFECDCCSKDYTQNTLLLRHITTVCTNAGVVNSLICSTCQYRTSSKKLLVKHSLLHDERRSYVCKICDYRFQKQFYLQNHLKLHSGEKPYKCNFCEYKCVSEYYLKRHTLTHTGEKPYKCDICDYNCARSNTLKIHLRTHTGEKPYKCDICDYKGAAGSQLRRHIRTHTGEKPYKCDFCKYKCTGSY